MVCRPAPFAAVIIGRYVFTVDSLDEAIHIRCWNDCRASVLTCENSCRRSYQKQELKSLYEHAGGEEALRRADAAARHGRDVPAPELMTLRWSETSHVSWTQSGPYW